MPSWTSELQQKVLYQCNEMYSQGYDSPVKPGCARSVAEVYFRTGLFTSDEKVIVRVYDDPPQQSGVTIWEHTKNIPYKTPGALVFFHYTYDAVPPSGVGSEDTYTHVGVLQRQLANGNWTFWSFRSTGGWTLNSLQEVRNWGWVVPNDFRIPKSCKLPD